MPMDLFVLFSVQDAPTVQLWNDALAERQIPVSITEQVDLSKHSGFLPCSSIMRLWVISIDDPVVCSLGFGGRMAEGSVVFYSASALTAEYNGIGIRNSGRRVYGCR